jgi:hypothetical protein
MTMTTATKPIEEAAFDLYAAAFGEKSAKRNARRVAVLAGLVASYGAGNVTLREVYTSHWTEEKALQASGVIILGCTSTSSTKKTYVVADCIEQVSAPATKAPATKAPTAEIAIAEIAIAEIAIAEIAIAEIAIAEIAIAEIAIEPATKTVVVTSAVRALSPASGNRCHGQLWEECAVCGMEPVCADCGYCSQHGKCGGPVAAFVNGEIYGGSN